jgi:hypothetical protein
MPEPEARIPAGDLDSGVKLSGTAHIYVAFDWGEEVDLEAAGRLLTGEPQVLARRRRTPTSFDYNPPPLRYALQPVSLTLADPATAGTLTASSETTFTASADATLFDFGGASVAMHLPLSMTMAELSQLAGQLSDSERLVAHARRAAQWLFERLRGAIQQPTFSPLSEEYVVFQLSPGPPLPAAAILLERYPQWVAGLARLECEPLSTEEIRAALQAMISYNPHDLLVLEWSAALLVDRDCDETLQAIEFANLQLLEYRLIDKLLDDRLADAYRLIHPLVRTWLPFWRTHAQPLRALGELRIHANSLFERTGNVLKLVGDQYLARVYRILAARFHLDDWEGSIRRSLEVVEGVYRVLADQAATYRTEMLEVVVIVLIIFEILMAVLRH